MDPSYEGYCACGVYMCVFLPFFSPCALLASRTIANSSFLTSSTEGHDFTEISNAEHTTSGSLIDSNISSGWNIAYTLNEQNICATVALHLAWSRVQRQHVGSIGHRRSQVLSIMVYNSTLKLVTHAPSVKISASASPEEMTSFFRPLSSRAGEETTREI